MPHADLNGLSGPLALPQAQQTEQIDCSQVLAFLKNDPNGQAFARSAGGQEQALQNFILLGPGADAQKVLFIMSFATILFGCINGTREIVKEAAIYKRERTVNLGILRNVLQNRCAGFALPHSERGAYVCGRTGRATPAGYLPASHLETYITLALTSLAGLMIGLDNLCDCTE